MSRFDLKDLPLEGLKLIERKRFGDHRGFLSRLFCAEELRSVGWLKPIAQINHTLTAKKGTVRGMHFQYAPFAEMKLVSCIRGEICDIAVDIRSDSSTFLSWHMERLSAKNGRALLLPEGFAHGFQALSDNVEIIYCHSEVYNPDAEAGLSPNDARLGIEWPMNITEMSVRDQAHSPIENEFKGVRL